MEPLVHVNEIGTTCAFISRTLTLITCEIKLIICHTVLCKSLKATFISSYFVCKVPSCKIFFNALEQYFSRNFEGFSKFSFGLILDNLANSQF